MKQLPLRIVTTVAASIFIILCLAADIYEKNITNLFTFNWSSHYFHSAFFHALIIVSMWVDVKWLRITLASYLGFIIARMGLVTIGGYIDTTLNSSDFAAFVLLLAIIIPELIGLINLKSFSNEQLHIDEKQE